VLFDLGRLLALCFRSRAALAAENLFLRKQLALFEERKAKPHPGQRLDPVCDGRPGQALRLAPRAACGQARHLHPLASKRISPILAVEVQTAWPAQAAE
jgi:hypothetical protein